MAVKEYDFDGVMRSCSKGSYLSDSLDNLQTDIAKLQRLLKELERAYHGIGKDSVIYKMYDALYNIIGRASNYNYWNNSGLWESVQNIVYKTNKLYNNALNDKELWEAEQRRIEEEKRQEEERRREEERRQEEASQEIL